MWRRRKANGRNTVGLHSYQLLKGPPSRMGIPVLVWIPPIDWAIGGDLHWISSKGGSSEVAMKETAVGIGYMVAPVGTCVGSRQQTHLLHGVARSCE